MTVPLRFCLLAFVCIWVANAPAAGPELEYSVLDQELKVIRLDSDPKESLLSMQLDSAGRLFAGGREALFVYEPDPGGLYKARQELYRFPNHTWIFDIVVRGDDLYVLTSNALYLFPDAVRKRSELKPRRLVWGLPLGLVHQGFHGMAIGPEGDIYFQHGDPLWNYGDFNRPDHWGHWTFFSQPEGTKTEFTGTGGVLKCRADGSNLEIISGGQRNSCGLVFDHNWNLFSNDNDYEGMPSAYVPGRLLHITRHAWFGWPRGWMPEKQPWRADLLETMNPKLGRFVPVGMAYYDDTYFPKYYRNNLFVARWGTRAVPRYPVVPRGASFHADEAPMFVGKNNARPVGVTVGRGGRVFITVSFMAHNEGSPVYPSDLVMITRAGDTPAAPFEAYEETEALAEKLWLELENPNWSRRYRAHIEITRRGGRLFNDALARLVETHPTKTAFNNLVWLSAASVSPRAGTNLVSLARSKNENARLQAARALIEFPHRGVPDNLFASMLEDPNPQVQHIATLGLFKLLRPPLDQVMVGPARSKDSYIRQAATLLLGEKATPTQILTWCNSADPVTRLAGVLAAGFRLTMPPALGPFTRKTPLDASRTNDYLIGFPNGAVDLRKLGPVGNFAIADQWNAAPGSFAEEKIFEMLVTRLKDEREQIRLMAAHFLSLLDDERSEPLLKQMLHDSEDQRLGTQGILQTVGEIWLAGPFDDGGFTFDRAHAPERGPVNLAEEYPSEGRSIVWRRVQPDGRFYHLGKLCAATNQASSYAYFQIVSTAAQSAQLLVGSADGVEVWHRGQQVWKNAALRAALPFQDVVSLKLQPGANDILVRVHNEVSAGGLYLDLRTFTEARIVLPAAPGGTAAADNETKDVSPEALMKINWGVEFTKGDRGRGRLLFTSLGCASCHAMSPDATSNGGPSLAGARSRFNIPYLVESILEPDKVVSPAFRNTVIELTNGETVSGLVVGETAGKLELMLPAAQRQIIDKAQIKSRRLEEKSPMPAGLVRSAPELRDLLAYLLGDPP